MKKIEFFRFGKCGEAVWKTKLLLVLRHCVREHLILISLLTGCKFRENRINGKLVGKLGFQAVLADTICDRKIVAKIDSIMGASTNT